MVESPIEPVAPSTVTLRTASPAALLLRKGTALIMSPNHKAAADAVGTIPQTSQNSRHDNGSNETVEAIHQTAMAGNKVAGILDAEAAFDGRFEQVAELGDDRERSADRNQGHGFERQQRIALVGIERHHDR